MKLTWHIVWKDVTRLRLALALWAAAFVWEFAIGVRLLRGNTPDLSLFERLRLYDGVAFGLQAVIGYVLIAALIHEDPLVGSTAFWPTRPISALRLLGAKLIGCLVIFWVFPVLLALPWWVFCGYGAREVLNGSLYTLYLNLIPLAVGLLIASLTSTISRYLAGTCVAVAVVCVGLALVENWDFSHVSALDITAAWEQSDVRVGTLIGLVLLGFPAIAAHQFLTRKLGRSLVALALLVGLILLGAAQRPLDLGHFAADARWPMPAPERRPVEVQFKKASLEGFSSGTDADFLKGREKQYVRFDSIFAVTSVPEGLNPSIRQARLSWNWRDGSRTSTRGWPSWQPSIGTPAHPYAHLPTREWWDWVRAHGYMKGPHMAKTYEEYIKGWGGPGPNFDLAFLMPGELAARIRSEPPSCTAEISGHLLRWNPCPEFALAPGNGYDVGAQGIRIRKLEWNAEKNWMETFVVMHEPDFEDLNYARDRRRTSSWFDVINRARRESAGTMNNGDAMRIATVVVTWAQGSVSPPSRWKEGQWINDTTQAWFDQATVVGGFATVAGRFEAKVDMDKFTFEPEAAASP